MTKWMGLDIGTSSVKAIVVDDDGGVIGRGSASYPSNDLVSVHEQDANDYLGAVRNAVADCGGADVDGIGVVGQTPSLVLVDSDGSAVRPVMTWRDTRARQEGKDLEDSLGSSIGVFGVDNLWDPSQLPSKMLWLARNDPETLARARWLLQPKDFVGLALTGTAASDLWSTKGLSSVTTGGAVEELFTLAGVGPEVLPPLGDPWSALGWTTHSAPFWGINAEIPVAIGWTDALAGMLGIGAITSPASFVLTGTSDIVGASRSGDRSPVHGMYYVPEACSPLPIDYGPTQSSGASLEWLASIAGTSASDLVLLSEGARETEAIFLPYLRGERAPIWNADVRAALSRIAETDGLSELALAVMRGVSLSDRHVLEECLRGDKTAAVHVGGANVNSPGWIRARQDVFEQDLVLHQEPQLPALGGAMLARTAATGSSLGESFDALRGGIIRIAALPSNASAVKRRFGRYRDEAEHALRGAAGEPDTTIVTTDR